MTHNKNVERKTIDNDYACSFIFNFIAFKKKKTLGK